MKPKFLTGIYQFKETSIRKGYVGLLCSEKSGKIGWLEDLKNEHGAIFLQCNGRLLLSEKAKSTIHDNEPTVPKTTVSFVWKKEPNGIMSFFLWNADLGGPDEVLILPPGEYGEKYHNRYRVLNDQFNKGFPGLSLYELYLAGELTKEISFFMNKQVNCH